MVTFRGTCHNGQVSGYTNGLIQTIAYVYDDAARLTTVDYPTGTDTAFTYDSTGRRTQMVDSTGTTGWTFDLPTRLSCREPRGPLPPSDISSPRPLRPLRPLREMRTKPSI